MDDLEKIDLSEFPKDMRKFNGPGRHNGNLTERISILVTPTIYKKIQKLVKKGIFPNKCEFGRYLIMKYFEDHRKKD